jgi:hypothetical protein
VEKIFQLEFEGRKAGNKNKWHINNLRYGDDTAILAENIQELQTTLNAINEIEKVYEIKIYKEYILTSMQNQANNCQSHDNAILYIN